MTAESEGQLLVDSLLPVSATVTSIYVVILVFVFERYQELEYQAAPRARIYFITGGILLTSFFLSGLSTIWLISLQIGVVSALSIPAAYTLLSSFISLVLGNLLIGTVVIISDIGRWRRRFVEWIRRQNRHKISSGSLTGGSGLSLPVLLGPLILTLLIGFIVLRSGNQLTALPVVSIFILWLSVTVASCPLYR